jgi:hypothetical protein
MGLLDGETEVKSLRSEVIPSPSLFSSPSHILLLHVGDTLPLELGYCFELDDNGKIGGECLLLLLVD